MTVNELKGRDRYNFECCICEEYKDEETDLWGASFVWLGGKIGAEYNFCIQEDGTNCSAIYKMELNEERDYMETDYDNFVHYEINFDDVEWERKLENAMCQALIDLFDL